MSTSAPRLRYELYHAIKEAQGLLESLERLESDDQEGLDRAANALRVCLRELKQPEARAVMERYLGRVLLKTEAIHHINGNQTDNRVKNLQVISLNN